MSSTAASRAARLILEADTVALLLLRSHLKVSALFGAGAAAVATGQGSPDRLLALADSLQERGELYAKLPLAFFDAVEAVQAAAQERVSEEDDALD